MRTPALAVSGLLMLLLAAGPAQATDRDKPSESPNASPQTTESNRAPRPSTEQTGGDTKPNAVDPAQSHQTGANAGEGASYSRSQEKGQSTVSEPEKTK